MYKKILFMILFMMTFVVNCFVFAAEKQTVSVYYNGDLITMEDYIESENGEILIPMRSVFEGLGASVTWNGNSKNIEVDKDKTKIEININSDKLKKDESIIFLDTPIKIIDSKAYMPLKVISQGFDIGASYNNHNAVLTITSYKNFDDIIGSLSDKEKSWMRIESNQYIQDFDFLYKELLDNYPYIALAERSFDIDIETEYEKYREKISECTNDIDFINIIKEFIGKFEYTGHISVWGYRYMTEFQSLKNFIEEFPEYRKQLTPYLEKLDNTVSKNNYTKMEQFYTAIDSLCKSMEDDNKDIADNEYEDEIFEEISNVTTKIIEDENIAYLKIDSFDMSKYNVDSKILYDFYDEIKNYPNLIIDITDNGGGGMAYFNDLIVAPLISKPITVSTYMLAKGGNNNRFFLQLDDGIKNGDWKSIDLIPNIDGLNYEDLSQMDYFKQENYTVFPSKNSIEYKGKIWLLVSPVNYSSSEYAAMFSKNSNFAVLVGETTSGDGIGVNPVYIILPNSGLVVQYSPIYGVAPDGTCSEEAGTVPDIISPEGENELETCIKAIKGNIK